ncbi:MAG: hypothetical protein LBP40_06395 [Campylobacteraceae bacterium]|jgi:hypothetical protein|nr:hypothetical protein [Campylobacteraceae bacterium]
MKHISYIISHIKQQPPFKKMEQIASYKKLLALLPPRYKSMVKFMYNRNDTLFFVLKHPGFKMEFNYNTTLIKRLLKELVKQDESCKCIDADNIKTFVTNDMRFHEAEPKTDAVPFYSEKSKGDFNNFATDAKLKNTFEAIREIICKRGNEE